MSDGARGRAAPRGSREGSGRPAKDAPPPRTETVWVPRHTPSPDPAVIDAERRRASCLVLVTDRREDERDDRRVLAEDRQRSVIEGNLAMVRVDPQVFRSPPQR